MHPNISSSSFLAFSRAPTHFFALFSFPFLVATLVLVVVQFRGFVHVVYGIDWQLVQLRKALSPFLFGYCREKVSYHRARFGQTSWNHQTSAKSKQCRKKANRSEREEREGAKEEANCVSWSRQTRIKSGANRTSKPLRCCNQNLGKILQVVELRPRLSVRLKLKFRLRKRMRIGISSALSDRGSLSLGWIVF